MRNPAAEDPQEQMAHERGITYVKLDGDIGILGNGAGLVMSTLDVVAQAGGKPANFLDVGGGAKAEEIVEALEVLLSDDKVKAVLFNIFGGITRCDEVANGILQALDRIEVNVPIVVRLDGTNDVEGRGSSPRPTPRSCTRPRRCWRPPTQWRSELRGADAAEWRSLSTRTRSSSFRV